MKNILLALLFAITISSCSPPQEKRLYEITAIDGTVSTVRYGYCVAKGGSATVGNPYITVHCGTFDETADFTTVAISVKDITQEETP